MKRFWLIIGLLTLLSLAACSAAGLVAENPEYAIIMKSKDNQYNEEVAESFRQVTEEAGYRCEVLYPESARAQDQVILVRRMMRERVKAIAIAVSDEHALAPVLKEAMAKGIVVTTLDSDTEKDDEIFFYCNSLEDLKSLTDKGGEDFTVAGCLDFGIYEELLQTT